MKHRRISLLLSAALLALGACRSTASNGRTGSESDWLLPTPMLAQMLSDEAARLPWTHGFERLEQVRWFSMVGEPAYDTLLKLAEDERDDVASAALTALGDTQDRRLVPYIHRVAWTSERQQGDLGLERARTLLHLGDWSEIPTLIRGLRDERQYTRSLCIQALRSATGETYGFDAKADLTDRVRAIDSWEVWWRARTGEGLLGRRSS
jgi:hypothetical protein